ncbi:MAG: response regulator, partial [Candidatus Moranbacteria bacterium]|nr:response regulator [Candidatus Moranbacteria bacterium]
DPNIKIIIFSNMSQNEDKAKALQLGANGFIVKSDYTPSQLVEEIKRFLNQYSEQQKNEVRINGNGGTPATAPANGSKKILMIEDEEVFIEMFGEKLKQDGYEMTFARNGAWGVKEALKGDFNLFIIDMVMPAMTGEEMVAKIKMEEKTKSVPILVLSASVEDETAKRVEAMGINGFFIKTQITPSDLAKKVEEIIGH